MRVRTSGIWGVVLYEMLTGHKPFLGETQADIVVSEIYRD